MTSVSFGGRVVVVVDVELVVELVVPDVDEVDVEVDDVLEVTAGAAADGSSSPPGWNSAKLTPPRTNPPRSTTKRMKVRFDIPDQSKARRES